MTKHKKIRNNENYIYIYIDNNFYKIITRNICKELQIFKITSKINTSKLIIMLDNYYFILSGTFTLYMIFSGYIRIR